MTQYNTSSLKLSNSQLNKLKLGIKDDTEVTLKISSNVIGDSNYENNFPYKLLLTNMQVSRLSKALPNNSSANIKLSKSQLHELSKSQLHKIEQSGEFLGKLLGNLLKSGLPLIGNVLKPLAVNVSVPLGLIAAALATDAAIHKKMFGPGNTTLITSNEEINNIMKLSQIYQIS